MTSVLWPRTNWFEKNTLVSEQSEQEEPMKDKAGRIIDHPERRKGEVFLTNCRNWGDYEVYRQSCTYTSMRTGDVAYDARGEIIEGFPVFVLEKEFLEVIQCESLEEYEKNPHNV